MKNNHLIRMIRSAVICFLILCCLSACNRTVKKETKDQIRIVAAIFPAYDWTKNILGENPADAELSLLLDNGVDLHSYQPSVDDILTISGCDLFIYVGGESDRWVTDALKQAENPDRKVIRMMDVLGSAVKEEELTEGMQAEAEENDADEPEFDEHVWLSLRNAAVVCDAIAEELSQLDAVNADTYKRNADAYKTKLAELDSAYQQAVSAGTVQTLLFGDRFPFRYLADDYGIECFAAFSGCSAETEASFETITFLSGKIDELSLPAVLTIDGSDRRIAQTIVQNTHTKDQKILTLDSMQSVSAQDIQNGTGYLSIMADDLEVLKQALEVR